MISKILDSETVRTFSRRMFLKYTGAGLISAAAVVFNPLGAGAQGMVAASPALIWKPSTFIPHIGQTFTVNGGRAHNVKLNLLHVQPGIARIYRGPGKIVNAPADECFILVFHGPRDQTLPQAVYEFAHPKLGRFSLLINPGKTSPQGTAYEAVVNHVHA